MTKKIGKILGEIVPGVVITLNGELGAGKLYCPWDCGRVKGCQLLTVPLTLL